MAEAEVLLHLVFLDQWPIYQQLCLEEALLRADHRNWCLINTGSTPAIVMGISGKPEQLIDHHSFKKNPVPVIRRFSGGGTVYVDHNTFFTTLIFNSSEIGIPCSPSDIFNWSETFYSSPFQHFDFKLIENDYTISNRKFGGNAQYLTKNRWLHHTSFLWDYDPHAMNYLQMPIKTPRYRQGRTHQDFLCPLKPWITSKKNLQDKISEACLSKGFKCQKVPLHEMEEILNRPHRKSTKWILCNF